MYAKVFGVEPYFFIQAPPGMQEESIPHLTDALVSPPANALVGKGVT